MNDKMIQNASKMIEENLTGDGNDAPVIWLHGNARREMGKLRRCLTELRVADLKQERKVLLCDGTGHLLTN